MYDAPATRATSRAITRHVRGTGIKPTQVKVKNIVPTNNLSATGSRKLPSFDAWEVHVRAIQPSAKSVSPANPRSHSAICNKFNIFY